MSSSIPSLVSEMARCGCRWAGLGGVLVRLIRRSLRQKRLAELGSCGTRMFVAIAITITIRHWIAHTPEEYAGGGKAQTSKW